MGHLVHRFFCILDTKNFADRQVYSYSVFKKCVFCLVSELNILFLKVWLKWSAWSSRRCSLDADFITGDLEDDTHLADAMGIWTWALHAADGGRETWCDMIRWCLKKCSNLTSIFLEMGRFNHQLDDVWWMIVIFWECWLQVWLGGGFKYFLFSPLPGEMIQFD